MIDFDPGNYQPREPGRRLRPPTYGPKVAAVYAGFVGVVLIILSLFKNYPEFDPDIVVLAIGLIMVVGSILIGIQEG